MCVVIHTFAVSFFQFIMVSISCDSYKMMIWLVVWLFDCLGIELLSYSVLVWVVVFCVRFQKDLAVSDLRRNKTTFLKRKRLRVLFVHGKLEIVTPSGMVWWSVTSVVLPVAS